MKTKEFNKLLSGIESSLTDKKPVMTIYSKSYIFTTETNDKMEGFKIDIIGNSVNMCLYVGYDKVTAKYGFKYETLRDIYNSHYTLTFNQKDKLIARLEYFSKKSKIV